MAVTLSSLPNETLFQIFTFLPSDSILTIPRVSRRFLDICQPLIWRQYCQANFKYWSPRHRIIRKLDGNVSQTDWKLIFHQRHNLDRRLSILFDSFLGSQSGRIKKAEELLTEDYDTKDFLLRNLRVEENADDVLARHFYSRALLGALHRSFAIEVWTKLREGKDAPLERVLGSFDMFVLYDRKGDLDEISERLDQMTNDFVTEHPDHSEMTPRLKCIALAEFLRTRNLVGIRGNVSANYHNPRNSFIGVALFDPDHSSLPLISAAIYCCIAQRMGLDAHPCAIPRHVLVVIKPPKFMTMDGQPAETEGLWARMFIDPFTGSTEVAVQDLKSRLLSFAVSEAEHDTQLDACPTFEVALRCARNIRSSIHDPDLRTAEQLATRGTAFIDAKDAIYGSWWATAVLMGLPRTSANADDPSEKYLAAILGEMQYEYPYDVQLVRDRLLPIIGHPARIEDGLNEFASDYDQDPEPKYRKTPAESQSEKVENGTSSIESENEVQYKVGQLFQHARYDYLGVITGWDRRCLAGENWIAQMRVNDLRRGQDQSFYHVQWVPVDLPLKNVIDTV